MTSRETCPGRHPGWVGGLVALLLGLAGCGSGQQGT
jgi:hypothetical protein